MSRTTRPLIRGGGAQSARDHAVDAVGAAVAQHAERARRRRREEGVEVSDGHAVRDVEQAAVRQGLGEFAHRARLEQRRPRSATAALDGGRGRAAVGGGEVFEPLPPRGAASAGLAASPSAHRRGTAAAGSTAQHAETRGGSGSFQACVRVDQHQVLRSLWRRVQQAQRGLLVGVAPMWRITSGACGWRQRPRRAETGPRSAMTASARDTWGPRRSCDGGVGEDRPARAAREPRTRRHRELRTRCRNPGARTR